MSAPHSPPSPNAPPAKRPRATSPDKDSPSSSTGLTGTSPSDFAHDGAGHSSKVGQSSNFRNVSACNRCRLRKNRCDQKLPSCASCEKARVPCVGYDPITKREIPRSYVFYLETRIDQLEALLRTNKIKFPPARNLEYCSRPGSGGVGKSPTEGPIAAASDTVVEAPTTSTASRSINDRDEPARSEKTSKHGGSSAQRHLGSANGVTFARVVFAAVQSSVSDQKSSSDKTGGVRPYKPSMGNGVAGVGTSMRDSFFGLHGRPTIRPAEFPDRAVALRLVELYFQHANPQIPVLHRNEFMHMFGLAYADEGRARTSKELYMLNMVFAIGSGIIMDAQTVASHTSKEMKKQAQPEEYHASAIVHLEACLSNSGGGLEELQAVLLLAKFALLRPVPPGLWYIVGVALRLAIDLGLHYEDGKDVEFDLAKAKTSERAENMDERSREALLRERGRREYVRDMRRRLWWCTYSLDRLVSTCVGRPFGVSDQVITTEFPSMLDDRYITPLGIKEAPPDDQTSYKIVAKHYWRLRLLQSEILQVLQYQQALAARFNGQNVQNEFMHTHLPSPFLQRFDSFRTWRKNIDQRLYDWKNSAPSRNDSGVAFSTEFLELNYWQAIVMLYRQSLSVPAMFESEYNTAREVNNPSIFAAESREDEERVYLKVAEAGQRILRLYRQLHLTGLVNYTYLATHHLFMAGISYLYAIWHSQVVRSRLSMDEVDFTILAATSVFSDLIDKCPPAEACRDAFDRTAKATVKMANSTGGFGPMLNRNKRPSRGSSGHVDYLTAKEASANRHRVHQRSSLDFVGHRPHAAYDLSGRDSYSPHTTTTQMTPIQATPHTSHTSPFQLNIPTVKPEQDGYSMVRAMPVPNLNTTHTPDTVPMTDTSSIDPVLLPSTSPQVNSPVSIASLTPQTTNQTPFPQNSSYSMLGSSPSTGLATGALNFADLQGMDFLQSIQEQPNVDTMNNADLQMDMGFGLGWEGMHHDFSEGQQVDLFDGFFFGGQQGGTNGFGTAP